MLALYHDWRSFWSIKVRLCLAEKGLSWESRYIDLMKLEHTTPEYLKLNPNGVVPTLVHDDVAIQESTIINEYLEEAFPEVALMPKNPVQRARARFWVKFEDDVLHPAIRPVIFALMMSSELASRSDDARQRAPICGRISRGAAGPSVCTASPGRDRCARARHRSYEDQAGRAPASFRKVGSMRVI